MTTPKRSNARVQDLIAGLVRGKRVLDVGCVDHNAEIAATDTWLHSHVARTAAYALGIDILEREIERLRQRGYNVICGDAARLELAERFDVITAGEILEHLDNPGQFLQNMRRHLKDDGILVLTTPNVFFGLHFLESLFASPYRRWNPEHVAWYCYFTLENLLKRNGMRVEQCYWLTRSRKIRKLLRLLGLGCPCFLASTLLVVARKQIQPTEVCAGGDG